MAAPQVIPGQISRKELNILDAALQKCRGAFIYVALFSLAMNLLLLMLPIFTLQVLDRVISSGSMDTLIMLSIVAAGCFAGLGLFQAVRSLTLVRLGEWLDRELGPKLLDISLSAAVLRPGASGSQNLRDLTVVRGFLTGPAITAIFDAPWSIIFIFVVFMIHPAPGFLSLFGGIMLIGLAILNEASVRGALGEANEKMVQSMTEVELAARNAEAVEAMGMMPAFLRRWSEKNSEVMSLQATASNRSALISSVTKGLRMILQIAVVSVGAYLVLQNSLTVGGIIACSILTGRALAPFEAAIGTWGAVTSFRKSYHRLKQVIDSVPQRPESIELPKPQGIIQVDKLIYATPGSNKPIVKGVTFSMAAGDSLGVVGPSAAGKSTLVKLLVGVWRPSSGVVRLDGADVYKWDREDFGKHVGYLPQDVELFAGTVRDNIARMQTNVPDEAIIAAAKMAEVHDMILHLPNGYETEIGVGGASLSAGQRQRIALARAFFGDPRFLVLDEPNASLDETGEAALVRALANAKAKKITTIVVTHRPALLNHVSHIMVLRDGLIADFGPTKEMLTKFSERTKQALANAQQQKAQQQAALAQQQAEAQGDEKAPETKTTAPTPQAATGGEGT